MAYIPLICFTLNIIILSNCVGLLDLFLKAEKLTKEQGEDYIRHLLESIVPELNERFNGDLLPYAPYFQWEKDLVKEVQLREKSLKKS